MFFPYKIKSIKPTDRVLEIGPGATPYFRSDIFLEKQYETEKELIDQSGRVGLLKTDKKVITYIGDKFPFEDKEFDYVICSHVLEHVDNADIFLAEVERVAKRGYLEFPTIYYDFIYNIAEHKLLLFHENGTINWMTKHESGLLNYASIQNLFFNSLNLGYVEMVNSLKEYFFQGFEWFDKIESQKVNNINLLTYDISKINMVVNKQQIPEIDLDKVPLKKLLKSRVIKKFFK
jgi:ubiquinone/menaquinone biosynthesis C-methylase UbiE